MKLGIDTYSLRWQGWNAFQFLDYSAKIGLDNVHFSERGNFESLEEGYLKSVKARAEELGLSIEIGMGSFDKHSVNFKPELGSPEQQLSDMLRAARIIGSPIVRCYLGVGADRLGSVPFEQQVEDAILALKAVAPLARDLGIKLAVENHGGVDLLARELKVLIEDAGADFVGACLDTGNPIFGGENPLVSAEVLGEYVISSHVRDNRVWATDDGAMAQWVTLGAGTTDLESIVAILKEKAPDAPVDLEIITAIPPRDLSYYRPESDFWKAYPNMLARDFARFVALAESGKPEPLDQLMLEPGARALPTGDLGLKLKAQQLRHFEESVKYAKEALGIGDRD